jgi:hypothetical protein
VLPEAAISAWWKRGRTARAELVVGSAARCICPNSLRSYLAPGRVQQLAGPPGGRHLEQQPQREDLLQVVQRGLQHPHAAVALEPTMPAAPA